MVNEISSPRLPPELKTLMREDPATREYILSLEQQALDGVIDSTTGLLTPKAFRAQLETTLHRESRRDHSFPLVYMDLDGFKPYNDNFGHNRGDEVLDQFGQMLRSVFRRGDIVGRMGGDEFALALPNGSEQYAVEQLIERVGPGIRSLGGLDNGYPLGVSCGVDIVTPESYATMTKEMGIAPENIVCYWIARSDSAMYQAKRQKRPDHPVTVAMYGRDEILHQ